MFGNIGFGELVLIFVVVLLVFGPRRIPEIARLLGHWIGELRRLSQQVQETIESEIREIEQETDLSSPLDLEPLSIEPEPEPEPAPATAGEDQDQPGEPASSEPTEKP